MEADRLREVAARRARDLPLERYSLSNPGQLFMLQDRERRVLRLLRKNHPEVLNTGQVLEVGCGTGLWIRDLIRWGVSPARITGVEL